MNQSPIQPPRKRDAILFLPGLGGGDSTFGPNQTVDGVAQRIVNAMSLAIPQAAFSVTTHEQNYGQTNAPYKARLCSINPSSGAINVPLIDVYGVAYGTTLTSNIESRSLPIRCILAFVQIVAGLLLISRTFFGSDRRATSAGQKAQLLWATLILFLLCVYLFLMLATAAEAITELFSKSPSSPPAPALVTSASQPAEVIVTIKPGSTQPAAGHWLSRTKSAVLDAYARSRGSIQQILIVLTALGLIFPKNIKQSISGAALNYLCALYYIRVGSRAPASSPNCTSPAVDHRTDRSTL